MAILVLLTVAGCSPGEKELGIGSEIECLERFAIPAGDDSAVQQVEHMCATLFDPDASADDRDLAVCLLPKLAEVGSKAGVRISAQICHSELEVPPAP